MPDKMNSYYLELLYCEFQKYEVSTMSVVGVQPKRHSNHKPIKHFILLVSTLIEKSREIGHLSASQPHTGCYLHNSQDSQVTRHSQDFHKTSTRLTTKSTKLDAIFCEQYYLKTVSSGCTYSKNGDESPVWYRRQFFVFIFARNNKQSF